MKKTIWCALCGLLALPALALAQTHSAMSARFTVDTRDAAYSNRPGGEMADTKDFSP